MDRLLWCNSGLTEDETLVVWQEGVSIYDGNDKTSFQDGRIQLTTHRIIWRDAKDPACSLGLHHSYMPGSNNQVKIENGRFIGSSQRLCLIGLLPQKAEDTGRGPVNRSTGNVLKFSFKRAGINEFKVALEETLKARYWEVNCVSNLGAGPRQGPGTRAVGILGIERKMEEKHRSTDKTISAAFEDLGQLMTQAKQMVNISETITQKLREKKGELTDDETAQFKAHLLSMGISDPVTRQSAGSKFAQDLARQLATFLEAPLKEHGGIMTLADVYCRVNRARGMELLSPDDLLDAVREMERLRLSVKLKVFDTGVMVIQLTSLDEEAQLSKTLDLITSRTSLSPDELARLVGISSVLAKERLLMAETKGLTCRDDSIHGLIFYPNMFNTMT